MGECSWRSGGKRSHGQFVKFPNFADNVGPPSLRRPNQQYSAKDETFVTMHSARSKHGGDAQTENELVTRLLFERFRTNCTVVTSSVRNNELDRRLRWVYPTGGRVGIE